MKKQPARRASPRAAAPLRGLRTGGGVLGSATLQADGAVRVALSGPGADSHHPVAVALDGVVHDCLELATTARGGTAEFESHRAA